MATITECRFALDLLSRRIAALAWTEHREHLVERTVSVRLRDLDTVFDMRLTPSGLVDRVERTAAAPDPRAQVRATATSDDVVAVANDRLDVAGAVLSGRIRLRASLGDMRRLRRLL